jgi:hypothetical protein
VLTASKTLKLQLRGGRENDEESQRIWSSPGIIMVVGLVGQVAAVDIAIHGDLNNRFNFYTNQSQMYKGAETEKNSPVRHDDNNAVWGEIKYRLWAELSTEDGKIKAYMLSN